MCWNKGRLCWKIAKLFYFCHLKKLVRPETFGPPYYVRLYTFIMLCYTYPVYIYIYKLCVSDKPSMSQPQYQPFNYTTRSKTFRIISYMYLYFWKRVVPSHGGSKAEKTWMRWGVALFSVAGWYFINSYLVHPNFVVGAFHPILSLELQGYMW